ncbi:hypothetical protein [Acidocella sp.]|uniref:hypothetical protein n=1 Tax=Acidocella sp. TaxID=50710 RepID=UPI003D043336
MNPIWDMSDADIDRLVQDIDTDGIGIVTGFLSPQDLAPLRTFVEQQVAENNGQYLSLTLTAGPKTPFAPILQSREFLGFMRRLYEKSLGESPPPQSLYNLLRCIKGETGAGQAYFFHYDSYYITALLPVIIPQGEQAGHLIIHRRRRPLRQTYVRNLIDKVCLDNRWRQKKLRNAAESKQDCFHEILLEPGTLYFFWGYRTIHGNAPCDPSQLRATALTHFGDPHSSSLLRTFTGKAKTRATTDKI